MRHLIRNLLIPALFAMAAPAVAQQAQPQTVLKETHGAWEVHCLASDAGNCYMSQIGKKFFETDVKKFMGTEWGN